MSNKHFNTANYVWPWLEKVDNYKSGLFVILLNPSTKTEFLLVCAK